MGDLMAITTWPNHQNLFYLVTSNAVTFDIKAQYGNAMIGLARKPGAKIDYRVGICEHNRCWIRKGDESCKSAPVQEIVSPDHYTRFWLHWNSSSIQLGRHGEQKPIVTYTNKLPVLKYITFGVLHNNPVHWKFDLPPVRPKFKLDKRVSGGKLCWVGVDDQLPDESLIGGFENETLYIIRASHRGSLTPGKFVPSEGGGYICWGGDAHAKGEFEVLCGFDCTWIPTCDDKIPINAFVGGYSEEREERLYVGRALHNGHMIPGKVHPSHKVCYIPFEGREIAKRKFEILVEPNETRGANYLYMADTSLHSELRDSESDDDNSWPVEDADSVDDDDDDDDDGYGINAELEEMMAL